ncbi:MAG TPA: DoxX family protein [Edaphobacter sp.]
MANNRKVVGYWIVTLLVLLPTAGSGFPELLSRGPAQTVEALQRLGYPLYLMKIIGFAKILGAVTLLVDHPRRLVEWAYAGFSFLFLGATASHLLASDLRHAPVPLALFLILTTSYVLHDEVRDRGRSADW